VRSPFHAAAILAAALTTQALAQAPADPPSAGAPAASASTDASYSASSLYNLANTYAHAGKPGPAILNYERAALLAPNDADIQANLKLVRSSAHVPVEAHGRLETLAHLASPATVALSGVLGVLIVGLSLLSGRLFAKRRTIPIIGSCLGLAAIAFTVCNTLFWQARIHDAVAIAPSQIRATPVPMGDPLQQLSEGETVTVTAEHEGFVLVRAASGRRGWAARADLVDVVPQ
jgi:tetratricopeptide (TPR) repeat protein